MSENLKKLTEWLKHYDFSFYLERNDFLKGGLSIHDEILDLIHEGHIDEDDAHEMFLAETIWSGRFYFGSDKNDYKIFYGANPETVIEEMIKTLESFV
jgi:hypothetical protein